jgi:hypothetical protein
MRPVIGGQNKPTKAMGSGLVQINEDAKQTKGNRIPGK